MYKIAPLNGWLFNAFRLNDSINDLAYKARPPNNLVVINEESQFPTQDSTTITLETGYTYVIGATITTNKRFIVQDACGITSANAFSPAIIYTGSSPMFTGTDVNWILSKMVFLCPNATAFSLSGGGIFIMDTVALAACLNVGTFNGTGALSVNWSNSSIVNIANDGLSFTGNLNVLSLTKITFQSPSNAHESVNLGTAVFNTIEMANIEVVGVSGVVGLSGASNSANLVPNAIATVESCNLAGSGTTPLVGITSSDIRWDFDGNSKIEDTIDDAIGYFSANATATVIVASSTNGSNAVKVAGVWSVGRLSKFSISSGGRATHLGERATTAPVDVSLHLTSVGGGAVRCKVYIAKNGVIVPSAATAADLAGNTSKNITIPWQVTFNQNDYIEVFVENQTNTNDILVEDAILRIR